jgi:hypothetical protein
MSPHKSKRVKQPVKGFLSGARKLVHPNNLFAGSSSSGSRQTQLLSHIESVDLLIYDNQEGNLHRLT